MKFLWLLVLASIACKVIAKRWPWELLGGQPRSDAVERAATLLGVRSDATREDIMEAHRRLVSRVHPDRGGSDSQVHEANAARDLLLGAAQLGQNR
ncbi:J domain-containing protein [Novosphingobium tardum]|uniref:J domain-containing protein n=1 Tax=Novosphingobium tardum TaxID=1538021 RepID=A0ABV8RJU6_9SPHN